MLLYFQGKVMPFRNQSKLRCTFSSINKQSTSYALQIKIQKKRAKLHLTLSAVSQWLAYLVVLGARVDLEAAEVLGLAAGAVAGLDTAEGKEERGIIIWSFIQSNYTLLRIACELSVGNVWASNFKNLPCQKNPRVILITILVVTKKKKKSHKMFPKLVRPTSVKMAKY